MATSMVFRDPVQLQETLDRCEKLIIAGVQKGMTELELNKVLTYASVLITLKADMHHAERVVEGEWFPKLVDKYLCEEGDFLEEDGKNSV